METKKQQRRERQHAAVREEIKTMARTHMARDGAAALSLRAVATDLGLSSAAIYYYFPNRDALITELIIDAFGNLEAALRAAATAHVGVDLAERAEAVMLAYRDWAVTHDSEYALLFGTPIPGYQAPSEITAPYARRALSAIGELFADAYAQKRFCLECLPEPPASISNFATDWMQQTNQHIPMPVLLATLHTWGIGHGLISLELDHHLQPIIGDAAALFHYEIRSLLERFGIRRTS